MMAARGAATIIAGCATGTIGALGAVATGTIGALATLALSTAVTRSSGSLGLIDAVEGDLAALIDLENTHLDLVAYVEDVFDLIDATLGDAGDVKQTVLTGKAGKRRRRKAGWKRRDRCTPRPAREP